jgi:hypothetical protein
MPALVHKLICFHKPHQTETDGGRLMACWTLLLQPCSSRKGAADAAAAVAKDAATRNRGPFGSTFVSSALQLQHLQGAAAQTKNKALQGVLVAGVGFHNAAMEPEDRALVEGLFKTGDLQVSSPGCSWVDLLHDVWARVLVHGSADRVSLHRPATCSW